MRRFTRKEITVTVAVLIGLVYLSQRNKPQSQTRTNPGNTMSRPYRGGPWTHDTSKYT
jgi:hypothetical protein